MNSHPAKLFALATSWLMLVAGVCQAQQTVVLSKPTDVKADKANSFLDNRTSSGADQHNAPRSLFDVTPPTPLPPPVLFQNQDPSAAEAANRRRNWTLLTPEEIMGVKTPEQILGVPAEQNKPKLTLEQEFLQRQNRPLGTNSRPTSLFSRDDNDPFSPFNRNRNEQNPFGRNSDDSVNAQRNFPGSAQYLDRLVKPKPLSGFDNSQDSEPSVWTSAFANPSQPLPTPAQIANMERFRAMLEPVSQPVQSATPTSFAAPVQPTPDPYLQPQPKVNPVGRTASSIDDDIGRPTGIKPLTPITGPVQTTDNSKPSWQAQPPPWLSTKPQPHSLNHGF